MCAIKPSVHHHGWITKNNWKICVHLCTAQSHPCSCPSGGLVSIDLCGWWGLTSLRHLAQQCPFKAVHLQQGACCSATLLHPASLFDKRPRLGLRWGVGVGPPHTTTNTTQMLSAACWQTHTQSRCQIRDSGTVTSYLVQWEVLCTGRPHLGKPPPPLFVL